MRKLDKSRMATVTQIARSVELKPRLELGIDAEEQCVYLAVTGRYRMTADQAEEVAQNLMGFVFELRNGGRIG